MRKLWLLILCESFFRRTQSFQSLHSHRLRRNEELFRIGQVLRAQSTDRYSASSNRFLDSSPVPISEEELSLGRTLNERQQSQIRISNYQRGIATIGFCTLVFASLSPVNHAALSNNELPVLLLNSIVSVVAFASVCIGGPFLESKLPESNKGSEGISSWKTDPLVGGLELGFWKFAGTTANLFGLSLTTVDHGAFLIQLTTLIVPVVQGAMGVPISRRIQSSIVLALSGILLFTQDHTGMAGTDIANTNKGDALCVLAAIFYAIYDLRLYQWGKRIDARPLMTRKIMVQAILSFGLLLGGVGVSETLELFQHADSWCTPMAFALILWSGLTVNALVPFLQVGGQQAIGPTASQTIYSSQPLWAAIMSYFWFDETVGTMGLAGGMAFLTALFLAATAGKDND